MPGLKLGWVIFVIPGHILSGSSGPDLLSKISGSDPDSTLYHVLWWCCLALVMMEVYFNWSLVATIFLRRRRRIRKEVEHGSNFESCLILWIMKKCSESCVTVCVKCAYFTKESEERRKIFEYEKYIRSFEAMLAGSCKCLFIQPGHIRITVQVSRSSGWYWPQVFSNS